MPKCTEEVGCECWGCIQAAHEHPSDCDVHAEHSIYVRAELKSNLCLECREELGRNLRGIEAWWPEVEDALERGRGGGDSERAGSDVHPPLPINAAASDAMRLAREAVWSGVDQLVTDRDDVRAPDDQTTPNLAGWLARWHLSYLSSHPIGPWTVAWYEEIQEAADAMEKASVQGCTPEVPTEHVCKRLVKVLVDEKEVLVKCEGQLIAIESRTGTKSIKCSKDVEHSIPWDAWSQMMRAKKPRGARVKGLNAPL